MTEDNSHNMDLNKDVVNIHMLVDVCIVGFVYYLAEEDLFFRTDTCQKN